MTSKNQLSDRNDEVSLVLPISTRSAIHRSLDRHGRSIAREFSKHRGPRRSSSRALSQLKKLLSSLCLPAARGVGAAGSDAAATAATDAATPRCFSASLPGVSETVFEEAVAAVVSCMNCRFNHRYMRSFSAVGFCLKKPQGGGHVNAPDEKRNVHLTQPV